MSQNSPADLIQSLEDKLLFMQRMGVRYLEGDLPDLKQALGIVEEQVKPSMPSTEVTATPAVEIEPKAKRRASDPAPAKTVNFQPRVEIPADPEALPQPPADKEQAFAKLVQEISVCRYCQLCEDRTNTVPGEGNLNARLMFVGEGPGFHEDQQGRPFVGRAGQLLDKMITAMGFHREEVFIANVVRCRPPSNRDPLPDEIQQCEPYLKKQIEIIQPEIIVGLGRYAVQTLLQTKTPISRLRGKWHTYYHIDFMPTFHPAYLLRNPNEKRPCWEDLQNVMKKLQK